MKRILFLLICFIEVLWISANSANYITEITPRVAQNNIDTTIQVANDSTQPIIKRTFYDAMYRPTLTYLYNYHYEEPIICFIYYYHIWA